MTISIIIVIFLGFAGGVSVGAGFVAFLTVLGIIPRLTQLSKTMKMIHHYEWAVVIGAVAGTSASLQDPRLYFPGFILVLFGLAGGIFVGMVAAALTEVLNVLPLLAKRLGIDGKIVVLLMAIVFGKVFGSLFHWMYFVD
ncbi:MULTISPECIES: stage V sporulation protein AB [Bacillaceae]|jgi:stage V sporulation protein AB|uniref:Stage V sporulation protein AB n=2 Tax=Bacillus infantis TaxID=324767 RepID=U5LD95_9BACI|nr:MULTISPECIES: stage V sporulation protein AB [Bacillus]OXT19245.1 stage V sporulation protein AB [Bacillus sp. OG2]AGX05368.1 stage V sporulation protein AB [Bacillus infantis NRRL B-14911]EAR65309.1 stage V sporulation protein AB [Bacillus sp. NRRL B-14911]MCA1036089.1 stage V sporulation protein AB [Bacillus infantis]MCA1039736.1 stage V sporulation protein AB [Bacillus infantis]